MTRRESLRAMISGGAAYRERPERKNARTRHQDEVLYRGRLEIPAEVLDSLSRSPVYRTTARHLALRVQRDGVTYLMRTALSGAHYVGEVVRGQSGAYRVHCWTVSDLPGRPVSEVVERDRERNVTPAAPPISAPITPEPDSADYAHYFEPDLLPKRVALEALQD